MSGSNDALTQFMMMQARNQQRRPSAQARLAEQMMASLNNPQPIYGAGPAIARIGSGVLAGVMGGMAERSDREREEADFRRMQEYQTQRETTQRQNLEGILERLGFGDVAGAPQAPQGVPQMAPQASMPMGDAPMPANNAAPSGPVPYGRNAGLVPQRDALLEAPPQQLAAASAGRLSPLLPVNTPYANRPENAGPMIPDPDRPGQMMENPWHGARGQLPGGNGRLMTVPPGAPQGHGPSAAPPAGRNYDAAALALAMTPGGERLAPIVAQMGARNVGDLREMNGPQGPGLYRITPNGQPQFVGGRMPLQESASSTRGPIPEGMLLNPAGQLEEIPGYRPRPPAETAPRSPERLRQDLELATAGRPSTSVSVDNRADGALVRADTDTLKAINEGQGQARSIISLLDRAERAVRQIPEGQAARLMPVLGQTLSSFGVQLPNTSEAEVLNALTSQLAGLQRIPGSGATTDYEMRLFMQAVPRLGNTREGNLALLDMGRRLAQRRIEEAAVWRRNVGQPDLMDRLDALGPVFGERDMEVIMNGVAPAAPTQPARPPGMVDRARQRNAPAGTPALPPGFEVVQ